MPHEKNRRLPLATVLKDRSKVVYVITWDLLEIEVSKYVP